MDYLEKISKNVSLIDIVLYALIAIIIRYALKMEISDLGCPYVGCDKQMCGDGNGTHYQGCDPEPDDDATETGKKIIKATMIHRKTVYWRRSIITTVMGMLILWLVLFRRLPTGPELMTGMFILGGIWYFSFNFYNYHHFDHAKNKVIKLVKILVEKCDGEPTKLKLFN